MTLSLWRYAHLALAVFSSVFLIVAAATGAILAVDAMAEKIPPYRVHDFENITLAEVMPVLKENFSEITEVSVDHNRFVTIQALDADFNDINAYIDPRTGKVLGTPEKKNAFIQWVTSLHRSLFLHETGRVIMGITAFLLLLIATSGTALILQRQKGIKRFFTKIAKDSFAQYYHVILGRLMLIPILIIALTGTYLSLDRFHFFGEEKIQHHITENTSASVATKENPAASTLFKSMRLADVQKIEFPFSDDPDEYYTLKLNDREIIASQFTGAKVSEVIYSKTTMLSALSLNLHTGHAGIIWALILAAASVNILFFIYSGFAMTLKRRSSKIKNKYTAANSTIILLAGSENGSTLRFANTIHTQLLASGHKSYLAQPNDYKAFPNAEHIILFTATHGLGDAPSNAVKLEQLIKKHPQQQQIKTSVVGFGSAAYPDFCGYAVKASQYFNAQAWAHELLPLFTVNDKSVTDFTNWVKAWTAATGIPLATTPALYNQKPKSLQKFTVLTKVSDDEHTFILTLKLPRFSSITSGDLLAIYPISDGTERLYSIGKIKGNIQLVVKVHENGLGSHYLNNLKIGTTFKARIVANKSFYLPKGKPVIMIANGTGIAPFLGMFAQGSNKHDYQLYCGFRKETTVTKQHRDFAASEMKKHHLKGFHMVFSREANKMYVMDLISRDAVYFATHFEKGGMVMICGSIGMQQDVEAMLDKILIEKNKQPLKTYKENGQLLADCY